LKWVRSLFGDGINGWNNQLVKDIFLPHDAEQILKIKVPDHDMEDTIAWQFEKSGMFTIKSAYHLATMLKREDATA
jgi:hypothetical protein